MAMRIMIQGTMSNAGKSLIAAGLCRIFRQDGYRVAPFKSQNMALNSFITKEGLEMGRAQVMQAEAAGMEPTVAMNPILLKPTNDIGSQVIVNGEVIGNMSARDYFAYKKKLVPDILAAYHRLEEQADIIVIEGAGSPGLAEDAGALLIHAQKLHHNQVQKRLHAFVVAVQMRILLLFHGIDDTPQLVKLLVVGAVNHLRVEKLMKKIRRGDRLRAEIQHHPRKCHILVAVGTVHRLRWEENTVPGLKLEELVIHQMIAFSAVEKIQLKIIVIVRL